MKKLNNKIDMFCYRHPRFGIPNLMLYVVVISLAVWLLSIMDSSRTLMSYFAFSPELILKGQVWRLITFMFIPQDTSMWALLFFYFYYWIGSTLEREWGTARFNIFIFSGVLLTIIYGMVIYLITKQSASIGTYYIYLSMFFSFATLYPDTQVLFMFIIPVKIKWLAYIDAAFFICCRLSQCSTTSYSSARISYRSCGRSACTTAKQRSTSTAKSRRSNTSSARKTTPISAVSAAEQTWIFPILNFVTAQNAQATTASVRTI